MPRQVRIEYEGACYHVMCRGDRREAIFQDDQDRARFLTTLGETAQRTGWLVHAYVLMSNHYHLLMETPVANLVRGMTWFQTTCTVRYNARHRVNGHLFAGRYKALLIDSESEGYFGALLNYIHLNPVRAGLIRVGDGASVLDYPWSSLPGYRWPQRRPAWLVVEHALATLQWKDTARDRRAFLGYVEGLALEEQASVGDGGAQETLGAGLRSTFRARLVFWDGGVSSTTAGEGECSHWAKRQRETKLSRRRDTRPRRSRGAEDHQATTAGRWTEVARSRHPA